MYSTKPEHICAVSTPKPIGWGGDRGGTGGREPGRIGGGRGTGGGRGKGGKREF